MTEKIGIYGGSFNPIHLGHLITANFVKTNRGLSKVIFIPCAVQPLRQNELLIDPVHRIEMIKMSIDGMPGFDYSDYEIKKAGISYTFETLEHFTEKNREIELIIGFDNILTFHKWKNPDRIFELATVVVLKRRTTELKEEHKKTEYMKKAVYLDSPLINISSTEIRQKIKSGLTIDSLVPENVKEYIYRNELYK